MNVHWDIRISCPAGGNLEAVRDRLALQGGTGDFPLRRRRGQGPHLAKRWDPRGFSAGLLLGRTEPAARAAELQLCAQAPSWQDEALAREGVSRGSPLFRPEGRDGP